MSVQLNVTVGATKATSLSLSWTSTSPGERERGVAVMVLVCLIRHLCVLYSVQYYETIDMSTGSQAIPLDRDDSGAHNSNYDIVRSYCRNRNTRLCTCIFNHSDDLKL